MSVFMAIPVHRLNEVVRGKRGVTADTALRLAKLLGRSAEFWLTLQTNCDLWHAAKAMRKASSSRRRVRPRPVSREW